MRFTGVALTLSLSAAASAGVAADIPSYVSTAVVSSLSSVSSSAMSQVSALSSAVSSASSSLSTKSATAASISSQYAVTSASLSSITASASSVISSVNDVASSAVSAASDVVSSASSVSSSANAEATKEPLAGDIFSCADMPDVVYGTCCTNLKYYSNGREIMMAPQNCKKAFLAPNQDPEKVPVYQCDTKTVFGRCCPRGDSIAFCNRERPIEALASFKNTGPVDYTNYFPGYQSTHKDEILGANY